MSIPEAIKGAQAELARLQSPAEKLRRIAVYARIICAELLGTLATIPYGVRAFMLHRSLPDARRGEQQAVTVLRGVRYGAQPRSFVDIYLPADTEPRIDRSSGSPFSPFTGSETSGDASATTAAAGGKPVLLFCHGGVWATGDAWHYAPMATRLAQAGIITAVMQYTLYPQALVPGMVEEVSQALTWTLDQATRLGGGPERVTLAGHSAGAQLCALALLRRVLGRGSTSETTAAAVQDGSRDARMPCRFVSMAGVFNIGKHLEFERSRDVHELSTMARAVGGPANFVRSSPAVILAAASRQRSSTHGNRSGDASSGQALPNRPLCERSHSPFYGSFPLRGDAIAHRIGFARATPVVGQAAASPQATAAGAAVDPGSDILALTAADAQLLPPAILQSSCADRIVPWHESAELHWALHDCGVPCRSLVYNSLGHGDFVVAWRPLAALAGAHAETSDLPEFAADLVDVLTDRVPTA